MNSAENLGVNPEAAAPEANQMTQAQADQEAQASQDMINTALSDGQSKPKNEEQDRNWRAMREKLEQLQRENEKERLKREEYEHILYQQIAQTKAPQTKQEVDEFANVSPDDWLTFDQSRRLAEKLAEKKAQEAVERALEKERERRTAEELPTRLKTQFQDFDAVVTEENIKQLREQEPEIAIALSQIGDKYAQAVAAYKYIKKIMPDTAKQAEFKQRIEQNSQKPGVLSSQSSALSKAQSFERGLTPELKKQLFEEMKQCAKKG